MLISRPWGEIPFRAAQNYLPVGSWWIRGQKVIIWKRAADLRCWSCHLHPSSLSGWKILQSTHIHGQGISLLFSMLFTKVDGSRSSLIQLPVDGMQAVVWTSTSRQTGVSFQQGFIHLKHEMPYSSELGCLKKEGPTGTAEPFSWVGHLNCSLPYSGRYQAALYKCDPSLYKLRKSCAKKEAECWLLLLYYFGQNTHTSKGQRTLKSECSWWSL